MYFSAEEGKLIMAEAEVPQRSLDGLASLDIFYDDFNDIHFFVEDEDQENLYEVIFRRLFPELKVARVFPLGGKQAVLDRCKQSSRQESRPPSIYVVDKDFDDLLGCQQTHPLLFYLDRYCIENYFLESDAVVEVVIESLPKLKRADVYASLGLPEKLSELAESMRPLFQLFFAVQYYNLGLKNCRLATEAFCQQSRLWMIDNQAVARYSKQISQAALTTPHAEELKEPLVNATISALQLLDFHQVVSGKHICALLFRYVKSKYNMGTITLESFLFRLAKNSSLSSLDSFAAAIRTATVQVNASAGK